MLDHATLRRAGRARRVDDGQEIVLANGLASPVDVGDGLPLAASSGGAQVIEADGAAGSAVHRHDQVENLLRSQRRDLGVLLGVLADDRSRSGVAQDVGALDCRAGRVDGNADCADRGERVVGQRPLETRSGEECNPVARLDAVRQEAGGSLVDGGSRLSPRDRPPASLLLDQEGGRVGTRVDLFLHEAPDRSHGTTLAPPGEEGKWLSTRKWFRLATLSFSTTMRTIWNGSLSFGLVTIPVGLAVAQQRQDVSFRTLHRECGTPIKQKRYCPVHERDVEADELVKGWEFAKGQYVMIEESDLEAVELKRSRQIELLRFVPLEQVDPLYFDRGYYLAPAADEIGRRPYALLLEALQATEMAAVGSFVLWGKQNLCLVRPLDDALVLETLYYGEDIRPNTEIREAIEATEVKKPELDMARQLVESLAGDFDPADYRNEYRGELKAMLEAKLAGHEIVAPEPAPEEAPAIDLVEALKQSIAAAKPAKAPASRRRKTAAR